MSREFGGRRMDMAWVLLIAGLCSLTLAGRAHATAVQPFPPGDIYVSDLNAYAGGAFGLSGGIIGVDPITGVRSEVSSNAHPVGDFPEYVDPRGLTLESGGDIIVVGAFSTTAAAIKIGVIRVDPATGARSWVSRNSSPGPGYCEPHGVDTETSGDLIVSDVCTPGSAAGRVLRVDPATGAVTELSTNPAPAVGPSLLDPWGVSVDSAGQIVVADTNAFGVGLNLPGGLIGVDPVTGNRSTISENAAPVGAPDFENPAGLPMTLSGDIEVSDLGPTAVGGTGPGRLLSADPAAAGTRTLISENGNPGGAPDFEEPGDLDFGQDIVVADQDAFGGDGGVISVDRAGGIRTTLSENTNPAGPPDFRDPSGIVVVRTNFIGLLLVPIGAVTVPGGNDADRRAGQPLGLLKYRLGAANKVEFTVERETSHGHREVGSFTANGEKGRNSTPLKAKIGGTKLKPGSYRVVAIASPDSYPSVPASVEFELKRR